MKPSSRDGSLDLNEAGLCCCSWLLNFPSGHREGWDSVSHRHMAEGDLLRAKVTRGQSNPLTSGRFISRGVAVALSAPTRAEVKGCTVSVPVVKRFDGKNVFWGPAGLRGPRGPYTQGALGFFGNG